MADPDLILAIDNGSQSLRALVFDSKGNLLAREALSFDGYRVPHAGWAEQDPDVFWKALCKTCRKLWEEKDIDPKRIAGLAITTQRGTVINLDKSGKPLRPAILWQDQRMTRGLEPVGGWWGLAFKAARLGDTMDYLIASAESNWLRVHQPEIWKQTHKYLLLSGYLTYKLTGRYVDSVGCQVGYFPFDYRRLRWSRSWDWKWQATRIPPEVLVELEEPAAKLGEISEAASAETGIPAGLPLIAAASDKACEVLGSGCLEPHIGSLSFGTSASVNITSKRYLEVIPMLPPYPSGLPGHYCLEVSLFRGFWMVEWFKNSFGRLEKELSAADGLKPEIHLDKMAERVPAGCGGLILQPYWAPGLKEPGPEARGTVIGFNDSHDRTYFYRAVLEGLAYALREGMERIVKKSKKPIVSLRVSGGGSQSDVAMQITADVFGLPATRAHTYETSGLGAAIICSVGLGMHPDFKTAVRQMSRTGEVFEPNEANHRLYDALYREVYLGIYQRMKPLYKNIRRILG
ncbi:MAG: FGGY-family carbohydrate kinase [Acidobacteriota bacterium]|nr:FGGY-family carbohydrate kinase [Acidobacteriota bacterium]